MGVWRGLRRLLRLAGRPRDAELARLVSAPEATGPPRDVPIDAESIRVAIHAAEDGIDMALETEDVAEFIELTDWRRQLRKALTLLESED